MLLNFILTNNNEFEIFVHLTKNGIIIMIKINFLLLV